MCMYALMLDWIYVASDYWVQTLPLDCTHSRVRMFVCKYNTKERSERKRLSHRHRVASKFSKVDCPTSFCCRSFFFFFFSSSYHHDRYRRTLVVMHSVFIHSVWTSRRVQRPHTHTRVVFHHTIPLKHIQHIETWLLLYSSSSSCMMPDAARIE